MRTRIGWVWLALAAFAGSSACGQGAGKGAVSPDTPVEREGTIEEPMTGDPLPDKPVVHSKCHDQKKTATRWLGFEPRVPLAISDKEALETAGQPCCAPWAKVGTRWNAVDAWGQLLGEATVASGEGYDVTRCYELEMEPASMDKRAALFASQGGSWEQPNKVEWEPTPSEAAALDRMLEDADATYLDAELREIRTDLRPANDRQRMYFELPVAVGGEGDEIDQPTLFAVVGGPLLVIAYVGSNGRWYFAHVDKGLLTQTGTPQPYTPVAVFDMDGDRYPEVIYQRSEGHAWSDVVLRVAPFVRTCWTASAESVGGATI